MESVGVYVGTDKGHQQVGTSHEQQARPIIIHRLCTCSGLMFPVPSSLGLLWTRPCHIEPSHSPGLLPRRSTTGPVCYNKV